MPFSNPTEDRALTVEAAQQIHDEYIGKGELLIWTVYDSPLDKRGQFVARPYLARPEVSGLKVHLFASTLDELREMLPFGLIRMERDPKDDAVIVETWI